MWDGVEALPWPFLFLDFSSHGRSSTGNAFFCGCCVFVQTWSHVDFVSEQKKQKTRVNVERGSLRKDTVSISNSKFRFCVSQALSFSEKRNASGTLVCEQSKKGKDECRRAARLDSARGGQQQTCTFKAVPGCVRNRAPLPLEGTPLQDRLTWPGDPSSPPPEVQNTRVRGGKTNTKAEGWRVSDTAPSRLGRKGGVRIPKL